MNQRDDQAAGYRHARLQSLVLEELRSILRDAVADPVLHDVRLSNLVLSVDYRHARVHFTVPASTGGGDEVRRRVDRSLARASPFLRAQLAGAIELKRTPDLRFVFDGFAAGGAGDDGEDEGSEP
jgi:ribosome-binding factor A